MNPRKRKLLKLKALEAKKVGAETAKPEPKVAPKPAPKAEKPAAKPVRKRKPRKTATKKEE